MFLTWEENTIQRYRPRLKKCGNFCTVISITICFLTLMTLLAILAVDVSQKIYIVYIDSPQPKFITDEKFLSIALDASLIANGFKHFHLTNPKLQKIMSALSPAYLRVGGTMADRLTFSTSHSFHFKNVIKEFDGGTCSYEEKICDSLSKPNFTMNAEEWLKLNELAENTGLDIIFDLNSLKRFENGSWNYANAEKLINFSNNHGLNVNWELGNEPNAYPHQFNYQVTPEQMAKDFKTLRHILNKYTKYQRSLLVGPDVTRPQNFSNVSQNYLQDFLTGAGDVINAVTWHQYYFNGATAKVADFLNPGFFDLLQWQINTVKNIVEKKGISKPIWLGETSSAYGGGAPHLSNRYIATFLWLDKLGCAAKNGLSVVIRQSIFHGNYALINNNYSPAPDWWVSILYKKLVSNKVVECHFPTSERIRMYCHCTQPNSYFDQKPSVTVFGINLNNRKVRIRFEGFTGDTFLNEMKSLKVHAYILTTMERINSRFIYLNGEFLELTETNDVPNLEPKVVIANSYVELPAYSLGFWVVPINYNKLPYC